MKNYSLQPTDKNAIELLKTNPIGRNRSVFRFVELLDNIDGECCTIAVNGEWGAGKTFFIKQTKLILDAQNPQSAMADETRATINKSLPKDFPEIGSYATVYYDAWLCDNTDDPILSLVYATINSAQSDFSVEKKRSLWDGAAALAEALSGRNVESLLHTVRGDDIFTSLKDADDIRLMVKEFINALIEEHGNRLVIFVDELDRCKPDFAIRFLERIKHYFDDDRVTFVFSVSLTQLQCTVKNYYGAEFNATRYLDKFFDLRMSLPGIDYERFLQGRFNFDHGTRLDSVCIETIKYFRLSLRETERYIRSIKISVRAAFKKMSTGFSEENARLFSVLYFVPIILGLQMTDMKAYAAFMSGDNPGPMVDILTSPNINLYAPLFLNHGEEYNQTTRSISSGDLQNNNLTIISVKDRLTEIYNTLFSRSLGNDHRERGIGSMSFSSQTRQTIEEIAAMLSPFSDYTDE